MHMQHRQVTVRVPNLSTISYANLFFPKWATCWIDRACFIFVDSRKTWRLCNQAQLVTTSIRPL
jgi:hypothetical protein